VFYFILLLQLDLKDAEELLSLAGYQFNPSSRVESFIRFCVERKFYDIEAINEFLYDKFNGSLNLE
jgi:hypothetical protein